jgi:hypothetical protein
MTLDTAEREFIRSLPKRIDMCPKLQAAKDKSLHAALLAEFNDTAIADRVMRVIKGERGWWLSAGQYMAWQ